MNLPRPRVLPQDGAPLGVIIVHDQQHKATLDPAVVRFWLGTIEGYEDLSRLESANTLKRRGIPATRQCRADGVPRGSSSTPRSAFAGMPSGRVPSNWLLLLTREV
jgi:hypothetical protein